MIDRLLNLLKQKKQSSFFISDHPFLDKIIALICFCLILMNLGIIITTPSTQGYEPSIIRMYPVYFWIFLLGSIFGGIFLILESLIKKKGVLAVYGAIVVFLSYSIFLFLPAIRGYFWKFGTLSDTVFHLGATKEIISTGYLPVGDPYAIPHIMGVIFNYCGLPLDSIPNFYSSFFSLILIISYFILGKAIYKNNFDSLILFLFAIPFLYSSFHTAIQPSFYSSFMIIWIFFLFHKQKTCNYADKNITILILIICLMIIFYHPATGLTLLICISCYILSEIIFVYKKTHTWVITREQVYLLILNSIIFVFWLISSPRIQYAIKNVYDNIIENPEFRQALIQANVNFALERKLDLLHFIDSLFKYTGADIILSLIAFVFLSFTLYKIIKSIDIDYYEFFYFVQFLGGVCLFVFLNTGMIIIQEIQRSGNYILLLVPIISAIGFHNLILKTEKLFLIKIIILVLIFSATFYGLFQVYPDAWFGTKNSQTSFKEKAGCGWFFDYREKEVNIIQTGISLYQWPAYHYGEFEFHERVQISGRSMKNFGYNNFRHLDEFYSKASYVIIYGMMRVRDLWVPEDRLWTIDNLIYSKESFIRLNFDPSVNKVYTTNEFEVWLIEPR